MLTIKTLRDNPEHVIEKLAVKNFDARAIVERVLELDANRRGLQTESDALVAQQKVKSAQIGALMKAGKREEAEAAKLEVTALKEKSSALLAQADENNRELEEQLLLLSSARFPRSWRFGTRGDLLGRR